MAHRSTLAVLAAALSACTVNPLDLSGKSCARAADCPGDYLCDQASLTCVSTADAGSAVCNKACTGDAVCANGKCVSASGCADGTRDSFTPIAQYPGIAGCDAAWNASSMRAAATGVACGASLGDCAVPADACGSGWHVCATPPYGPSDVSGKVTVTQCLAQPGAYAMAVGDRSCEPCTLLGSGAACCGATCVQQNGDCIYPAMTAWFGVINSHVNLCADIESKSSGRGVLCCVDP